MTNTALVDSLILTIRGHNMLLDADLAAVYGVPTKRLNEQVKRNADRFPEDFRFQLSREEAEEVLLSRSQSVTLKRGQNIKYVLGTLFYRFISENFAAYIEADDPDITELNAELKTTVAKIDHLRAEIDAIVAEIEGGAVGT